LEDREVEEELGVNVAPAPWGEIKRAPLAVSNRNTTCYLDIWE
jgi:hypothetical protein